MSFEQLGLSSALLDAINDQGYSQPSPIQEKAIPIVLKHQDLLAAAQTGTGKTAAFVLPILELLSTKPPASSNHTKVLIIAPTRELAQQISDNILVYGQNLPLRSTVVYGGVKINPQMMKLRKGVDLLVATPGRLLDLYQQNAIAFDELEILVLDEADRMLDMGFIHDIRRIIQLLPKQRQNLLFSATFSNEIRELSKTIVHQPVEVSVTPKNTTAKTVKQWIHPVDKKQKTRLLVYLIREKQLHQVLVFCRTKHGANRLVRDLEAEKIKSLAIHGNKSQNARLNALNSFKQGKIQILVATDIAARGIDIEQLPYVINFDLPHVPEDYVHRIGRTGRAGMDGHAISLVSADEFKQLSDIERLTQKLLERVFVDGFDPVHTLPVSVLRKPYKPKKPKKNKQEYHDGQRSQNASAHQLKQQNKQKPNSKRRNKPNTSAGNSMRKKFRIKPKRSQ